MLTKTKRYYKNSSYRAEFRF